jgi:hypothetical protein
MVPLLVTVAVFLTLSLWLAHTKAPWCDEGWFANPAYNLAFRGNMGTSVLEPSGFHLNAYFRGVQSRTYLFPPNHLVALAGWFRLFGPGIVTMRIYSICWSAVSLVVLFYLFSQFFPDRRVAVIGTLFTATDFIFLWSTADGRTEASANALALCAVASYVYFREKNFWKAVICSQILGASAVFIHPNAALVILGLGVLAWRFDRGRFRRHYLFLAVAPYLFFALLWSSYILQNPGDFIAQFLAHAAGHHSERLAKLFRPDIAIGTEIVRYLAAYCVGNPWSGVMKRWMVVIPFLYLPAVVWFLRSRRRHELSVQMLLVYTVTIALGLTFLNGFKGYFYLIYIVPIYDAIFAAWLLSLWRRAKMAKSVAVTVALAFVSVQLSISIQHIRADEYHRDYEPTIRDMVRYRAEGKSIVGTAALGFGIDFAGFKDDVRLGMYSGLDPDVLVMDRSYRHFAGFFEEDEPPVFTHIVRTLSTRYSLAAQHGSFWIFERVQPGATGKALPCIDPQKIETVEKGKRAASFFRLMFSVGRMRDPERSSL